MIRLFPWLILIFLVSSCSHEKKQNVQGNTIEPIIMASNSKVEKIKQVSDSFSIVIKDSSDYSSRFINSLETDEIFWKYTLNGNLLITNNQDTSKFPEDPSLGKVIYLTNKKENLEIKLTVKRVFLSTIEYKLELIDNGKPLTQKGFADLSSHFFLGSESDIDDSSGYGYFSVEYWDKTLDYLSIRIGKEPIKEEYYRGKIICKLGSYKIDLDNFPTLIEK